MHRHGEDLVRQVLVIKGQIRHTGQCEQAGRQDPKQHRLQQRPLRRLGGHGAVHRPRRTQRRTVRSPGEAHPVVDVVHRPARREEQLAVRNARAAGERDRGLEAVVEEGPVWGRRRKGGTRRPTADSERRGFAGRVGRWPGWVEQVERTRCVVGVLLRAWVGRGSTSSGKWAWDWGRRPRADVISLQPGAVVLGGGIQAHLHHPCRFPEVRPGCCFESDFIFSRGMRPGHFFKI